ncbi:MAG: hypothetical protein KME29_04460 [Calothrix sp. FI2-JRJ7]|jgi:hypothetical protein|nr:hypothetical protein [Calothrix sp. FI2-JRJ7]
MKSRLGLITALTLTQSFILLPQVRAEGEDICPNNVCCVTSSEPGTLAVSGNQPYKFSSNSGSDSLPATISVYCEKTAKLTIGEPSPKKVPPFNPEARLEASTKKTDDETFANFSDGSSIVLPAKRTTVLKVNMSVSQNTPFRAGHYQYSVKLNFEEDVNPSP